MSSFLLNVTSIKNLANIPPENSVEKNCQKSKKIPHFLNKTSFKIGNVSVINWKGAQIIDYPNSKSSLIEWLCTIKGIFFVKKSVSQQKEFSCDPFLDEKYWVESLPALLSLRGRQHEGKRCFSLLGFC